MRNNKYKVNNRGVSPVIAVILMVAITVVLSGLLWAMLQVNPAQPKAVNLSASLTDKQYGYQITITAVSQKNFNANDMEIQMMTNEGTMDYSLRLIDSSPAPFYKGLSLVYALTVNSTVLDINTGNPVDGSTSFDDYTGCAIVFVDEDADNKVNTGDTIYVYNDYNNDGINDILPTYSLRILIDGELALTRKL
jgi:flagellin-like protein